MTDRSHVPLIMNEKAMKKFMDLKNGSAGGREDPIRNLAMIDEELARPNLHAVAKQALMEERTKMSNEASNMKWEDVPADAKWEDVPSDTKWEDVTPAKNSGPAVPFKSGTAFEESGKLIPDMGKAWETFKKQWANRENTPMTPEVAQSMMADEKTAGTGVLDIVGGIPSMLAGGVHGIYETIKEGDATAGLKAGSETMSKLLPSALLPEMMVGKDATEGKGYKATMAPVTLAMDVLNAVPTGYGEMLNAAGEENAAAQVTDAGKLGIMTAFGAKGTKGMIDGFRNKKAITDPAGKLDNVRARLEEPVAEPTAGEIMRDTAAHADDFAAVNPYDVGGHVSKAQEGRPSIIDNAQGELFGGDLLQEAQRGPDLGQASLRHEAMPYEKTSPLALEPMTEGPTRLQEMGKELNEFNRPYESEMGLVPKEPPAPLEKYTPPAENAVMGEAMKRAESEAAYKEVAETAAYEKEAHYRALEDLEIARRAGELDFQHAKDVMGDKSLMSQEHSIMMRGQLRIGDVKGALQSIVKHHPNVAYRELATYLTDKMEGLKVVMHKESTIKMGERDVTGYYDPTNHTVGLSGLGATSPHTVLHELTHALTSKFINERPNDIRVSSLIGLHSMLAKEGKMAKEFPGIVNSKEFVAEAFSNPRFQKFLKEQRMNNRSVWNRFVDGIKSIFGIKAESQMATAFERAVDLGQQIVEAQTGKGKTLEQFKKAGMPGRLADLMAQAPHDMPTRTRQHEGVEQAVKKIPGLESPISDFAFYDKPLPEIIKMAQEGVDIPTGAVEKFAQQMQGGALFESLKTRNPVVKYTYERVTRAFQEATHQVKVNLTDPVTGIKARMRDLTPNEKGEIHAAMMMHEGKKELSAADLAADGFNEKQIAYAMRHRELDNQFFEAINERRKAMGMAPMDKRVAHIAGRFMGDFSRMVFKEVDGKQKVVGRISGSTKWELERASKYIAEHNPGFILDKVEYNGIGKGRAAKDKFAGMMEAINFLEKTDADVKVLMDSYQGYLQQDAVNYLNVTRHAKAKVKEAGGIVGSEGNKPWQDAVKNAEEGMKAQLAYYEQGYQWMAMEKATSELKQLLGDEGVVKQMPEAVKYADKYVKHAMGREQGVVSDALNSLISKIGKETGIGHSNIMTLNNTVKHLIMQKFMGLGNIPFTVTQLMQPLQTQPAMVRLLRSRGLEFSTLSAQTKAVNTYLNSMLKDQGAGKLSEFESAAVKYADEMSVFDVKMADHTKDINESRLKEGYNKLADLNITAPEHLTRGTTFLFYSHLLKDAGIPAKDIFGAAENMTNMSMVNYHQIERPMGYAKLGWLGDVASTLTRYKHNQWSQLAFYTREGVRAENGAKSMAPLATFLGSSLAFGGLMGFFAYQEADAAYQLVAEKMFKKPDSITNQILKSDLPSVVSHGVFSSLGVDMTTRFSNANAIPDSIPAALMPYGSAVWDMAETSGRLVLDPFNTFKQKQAVKSWAPLSVQGALENSMFTEKSASGADLYINPADGFNMGKGRVERDEGDKALRNFGFRNMRESKELAKNYSDGQIAKSHKNLAEKLITKAKYDFLGDRMTEAKLQEYAQKATEHGMSPDAFMSQIVTWSMDRKLPQKQQILLRNANKGFTGAFNVRNSK